jgi:hypothetical protein
MIVNEYWEVCERKVGKRNWTNPIKPVPVPFCSPQILVLDPGPLNGNSATKPLSYNTAQCYEQIGMNIRRTFVMC